MKELINELINYIKKEKKQILFALFAFIIYYFFKPNTDMIINAAPAVAAAGIKAAAKVAAKAAAKGAATGAAKGAVSGVANKEEGDSTLGSAFKGAKSGAISGAKSGAISGAKSGAIGGFKSSLGSSIPKNTNPSSKVKTNQNNMNTAGSDLNNSDIKNISNKSDVKKDADKSKDGKKKNNFNKEGNIEDDVDNKSLKSTKKIVKLALTPFLGLGCSICFIFAIVFAIPLMVLSITDPISQVISKADCDEGSGICDEKNSITGFFEKLKNLLMYQTYGKNEEVVAESVKDSYKTMLEKYQVSIDMPVLASTLLVDVESLSVEVDDDGNEKVNKKILDRIEYADKLAEMQIDMVEVAFDCKSNGNGYYKETNYTITDYSLLEEGECNKYTAGQTLKEVMNGLDLNGYYEKLKKDKDLLRTLYDDVDVNDEDQVDNLINTIKDTRDLTIELYTDEEAEDVGIGNVPSELFYDTAVNMASPLKGSIGVTSPYGNRTGLFGGMHKGIDLVSNEKTVYAAGDGVVIRANTEKEGGNVIEIMHTNSVGEKYVTTYAHLSQFLVKYGDNVKSGDAIGIMGCTGTNCTGVHLHFQIQNAKTKVTYNPANVITRTN